MDSSLYSAHLSPLTARTPAITSLCPAINFVAECITMSAHARSKNINILHEDTYLVRHPKVKPIILDNRSKDEISEINRQVRCHHKTGKTWTRRLQIVATNFGQL